MNCEYDVTVSVWNDFWAPELCEGLARHGWRVLALRSERSPLCGVETRCSHGSLALTRFFQRFQTPMILEAAENTFERFAARHVGRSPVFWGWSDHNLSPFQKALAKGQRIICERGSTHSLWAIQRLNQVHRALGWGPTDLETSPRMQRAVEEYKLAEKIAVPSRFVAKTFIDNGISPEKLHINGYGVDLQRWHRVQGARRNEGPLVFIYTASLIPRKGVHILIKAWERAGLSDCELWLCGSVHMPLEGLGLHTGARVKFLGRQDHAALEELYDRASVYLLPSFEEGMARSGIEALAAGLPAIITEETGLTDLMSTGHEGWVVRSGDEDQLVEVLRQVASNRHTLADCSKAARKSTSKSDKKDYGDRAAAFLSDFLSKNY